MDQRRQQKSPRTLSNGRSIPQNRSPNQTRRVELEPPTTERKGQMVVYLSPSPNQDDMYWEVVKERFVWRAVGKYKGQSFEITAMTRPELDKKTFEISISQFKKGAKKK